MSRRDVETVATLAAHLAEAADRQGLHARAWRAARCASDAMRFQKLGARARRATSKGAQVSYDIEGERIRIRAELEKYLTPYGMLGAVLRVGVAITDLPPNTNLAGAFVI